jgi:hypothetical protein
MTWDSLESLVLLAIGFAVAGMIASGYKLLTTRQLTFELIAGGALAALPALPMLAFAAPFIIMRNTVRARILERRPIEFVMLATALAGLWSFVSGAVLVVALGAMGILAV